MNRTTYLTLLALSCAVPGDAAAQGFLGKVAGKAGGAITGALNTATKVATAPIQVVVNSANVVTGQGSVSSIYQPYQDLANSAAGTVTASLAPQQVLYNEALTFASKTGGEPGAFLFDVGTFSQQYFTQLVQTGVNNVNAVIQGQNPFQLSAAPLAAAIRAAEQRYTASARPIPADVRVALRNYFPETTLNRAKYTIGRLEITLPNFINQLAPYAGQILPGSKFGDRYAVTVGSIIVFNSEPASLAWWAHELTHVQQYERMGIEGFAYAYAKDAGHKLEREADANEKRISDLPPVTGLALATSSALTVNGHAPASLQSATPNQPLGLGFTPEQYVAQCFFPGDPYPVHYMVTSYGRILAVDPLTGQWLQVGFATPPLEYGVAWTYQTLNFRYLVRPDGRIYARVPVIKYQQVVGYNDVQIGHVVRLL